MSVNFVIACFYFKFLSQLIDSESIMHIMQLSKGEPMDVDLVGVGLSGSHGEMVPPQVSPRRTDHVPPSSTRQQGASQVVVAGLQGSTESTLVSLLSQPSSKDDKQLRRGSGTDQDLPSTKVNVLQSVNGSLRYLVTGGCN